MRCPRCDGRLTTYTLGGEGSTAVDCEACGFAGVPASHRSDTTPRESWEAALDRVGTTAGPLPERTRLESGAEDLPPLDAGTTELTTIDGSRLDGTGVTVTASLGEERTDADE